MFWWFIWFLLAESLWKFIFGDNLSKKIFLIIIFATSAILTDGLNICFQNRNKTYNILVHFILILISQSWMCRFLHGIPLRGGQKGVTIPGLKLISRKKNQGDLWDQIFFIMSALLTLCSIHCIWYFAHGHGTTPYKLVIADSAYFDIINLGNFGSFLGI